MNSIKSIIEQIAGRAEIVAATKTQPPQLINQLKNYGITKGGENRVQEFLQKYEQVSGIEWHFIGRLQTNKVKYIVDKVALIHSLDKISLADEIEAQCRKKGTTVDVLIELNAGEQTKGGVAADQLSSLAHHTMGLSHVRLRGLMCLPPPNCSEGVYESIAATFLRLKADFGHMDYLSLGTSHDFMRAIEYGSNMVRLGTVLFGQRN